MHVYIYKRNNTTSTHLINEVNSPGYVISSTKKNYISPCNNFAIKTERK